MAGPLRDKSDQDVLAQDNFSGGMNMINPGRNQFRDGKNFVCRFGKPRTRPGCRQYFGSAAGFIAGYWFNEENVKYNDATHLGFWFDYDFVRSPWGQVIQGTEIIRLAAWDINKIIFASGGFVYVHEDGYLTSVLVTPSLDADETVRFLQANNDVYMFRSDDGAPLYWDGSDAGFVVVPDAAVGDDIPHSPRAIFHGGRIWPYQDDDVQGSGVLEFTEYNLVTRYWTLDRGAGERGVFLYGFRDDIILAFKRTKIFALRGVNAVIASGTDLSDYVYKQVVDEKTGAIAEYSIVSVGEDVWYLGNGGIYSLRRNQESNLYRDPVAVSAPIQPYINRINWAAASGACAITHDNYVLFAVPIDGSITNNIILVFDRLMGGEALGAWDMPWISQALNPIRFFADDEKLIFLSADFRIRQLFTNDPWDSEDALSDTPRYAAATYQAGIFAKYNNNGDKIYKCLSTCQGILPTDTDYWEEQPDIQHVYDIESSVELKQFELPKSTPPLRFGRGEVLFRSSNTKVSVDTLARDQGDESIHFVDKEYPRTEYDTAGTPDWLPTNENVDFEAPHRQDYTKLIGTAGHQVGRAGLHVGRMRTHNVRYLPMRVSNKSLAVRITNKRGKMEILSVSQAVAGMRHASMEVV